MKFIDITGQTFGRWTVESRAENLEGQSAWNCLCSCGVRSVVRGGPLRFGKSLSCGCLAAEEAGNRNRTHGMRLTPIYKTWDSMKARCLTPTHKSYPDYGGRGITICARWLESFENFRDDMGDRPEGMTLDRIDNAGNYEPSNCRWATSKEQGNNKRSNTWLAAFGESKTIAQWSRDTRCAVSLTTLGKRLEAKWDAERAITVPLRKMRA